MQTNQKLLCISLRCPASPAHAAIPFYPAVAAARVLKSLARQPQSTKRTADTPARLPARPATVRALTINPLCPPSIEPLYVEALCAHETLLLLSRPRPRSAPQIRLVLRLVLRFRLFRLARCRPRHAFTSTAQRQAILPRLLQCSSTLYPSRARSTCISLAPRLETPRHTAGFANQSGVGAGGCEISVFRPGHGLCKAERRL